MSEKIHKLLTQINHISYTGHLFQNFVPTSGNNSQGRSEWEVLLSTTACTSADIVTGRWELGRRKYNVSKYCNKKWQLMAEHDFIVLFMAAYVILRASAALCMTWKNTISFKCGQQTHAHLNNATSCTCDDLI